MTMSPSGRQRVDVVLFGWAEREDVSPLRSSLSRVEQDRWQVTLQGRVAMPKGQHDPSTCYLRFLDAAVLMHREAVPDRHGRPSTRTVALIGPHEEVTFERAVALRPQRQFLADWVAAWEQAGTKAMGGYPTAWRVASDTPEELRAQAKRDPDRLTALVAGVLGKPSASGYVVDAQGIDVRPLLWAASHIMRGHARDMDAPDPTVRWTFSTSESSITAPGLPWFCVITEPLARSSRASDRTWVDLGRRLTASDSPTVATAQRYVDAWRRGEPISVEPVAPRPGLVALPPAPADVSLLPVLVPDPVQRNQDPEEDADDPYSDEAEDDRWSMIGLGRLVPFYLALAAFAVVLAFLGRY